MKSNFLNNLLPLALSVLISAGELLPVAIAQTVPARINILVVEGEGVTSRVRHRVARDPVVKIEDDDHQPVAGAAVVFALPISGTSGEFTDGAKTLTVITGKDGLAAAPGLRTNQVPGNLQIYVTASYQGLRARSLVTQFVEGEAGAKVSAPEPRASRSGGKWKWIVLGAAAAGGAGAGLYFGRNTTAAPISVSAGTVVFGSPR
jgi:hypothetical protein